MVARRLEGSRRVLVEILRVKSLWTSSRQQGRGFQGVVKRITLAGGPKFAWIDVPNYRFDWSLAFPFAGVQGNAMSGHMGTPSDGAKLRVLASDKDENLLVWRAACPARRAGTW